MSVSDRLDWWFGTAVFSQSSFQRGIGRIDLEPDSPSSGSTISTQSEWVEVKDRNTCPTKAFENGGPYLERRRPPRPLRACAHGLVSPTSSPIFGSWSHGSACPHSTPNTTRRHYYHRFRGNFIFRRKKLRDVTSSRKGCWLACLLTNVFMTRINSFVDLCGKSYRVFISNYCTDQEKNPDLHTARLSSH